MDPQCSTVEERIARLASRSHGVVTRAALLDAGVTAAQIRGRVRKGAFIRQHAGVYHVGHRAPCVEARYLAAVLACGAGAVLSGRAAGHLLGLLKGTAPRPEVTATTWRRVTGVTTKRSTQVDATTWRGIPTTTVPRTLVDLAAILSFDALARACHEAGVRHGTTPRQVEAILDRRPNAKGATKLRRILLGDAHVTLSTLEKRFLNRLRDAALPLPRTNRPAGTKRVDCRWPEHRLTVELDGYTYHASRYAWEQDRRREREAHARGDQFRRYTYGDVYEHPRAMLAELQGLLRASRRSAVPRG
jgi:very-short-patch-repair endonuclease